MSLAVAVASCAGKINEEKICYKMVCYTLHLSWVNRQKSCYDFIYLQFYLCRWKTDFS